MPRARRDEPWAPARIWRGAPLGCQEIHVSHGFCTGQDAAVHFGLGAARRCDVEVVLPNGRGVVRTEGVAADRVLVVREPQRQ